MIQKEKKGRFKGLIAMGSNLLAMASNLIAMASNLPFFADQPCSPILQENMNIQWSIPQ